MKRRYLTAKEWNALYDVQGGCCAICGCRLRKKTRADHTIPGWFVHHKHKPDQIICRPCDKAKTARDLGRIAKTKRQMALAPDTSVYRLIKKAIRRAKVRKMQGRPFDRKWKRKLDGTVVRRAA